MFFFFQIFLFPPNSSRIRQPTFASDALPVRIKIYLTPRRAGAPLTPDLISPQRESLLWNFPGPRYSFSFFFPPLVGRNGCCWCQDWLLQRLQAPSNREGLEVQRIDPTCSDLRNDAPGDNSFATRFLKGHIQDSRDLRGARVLSFFWYLFWVLFFCANNAGSNNCCSIHQFFFHTFALR